MEVAVQKITFAHFSSLKAGDSFKNYSRSRGVCGIVVPVSGSAIYTFASGEKHTLAAGEIAVFSDKAAYSIQNLSDNDFMHYTVNFTLFDDVQFIDADFYTPKDIKPYIEYCKNLIAYTDVGDKLRAVAVLYNLLADTLDNLTNKNIESSRHKRVKPAIDFIECEYAKPITSDILAEKCIMSNTNFRRVFKSVCGVSPIEYLLRVRLERAKQLLLHTALTVEEVALQCGFNEVSYFSRLFKKRYNKSPLQYRDNKTES